MGPASSAGSALRAWPYGNPDDSKDCNTKQNKQPKVIQLPTCLRKLVAAEIVAESTGWSVKHVYRLAQQGLIPHFRMHGSVRFDPQEIADWLEAHRIAA